MDKSAKRRELEEQILSKRQQIAFENDQAELSVALDGDNIENPDVMEETKNFNDPASGNLDKTDLAVLKKAKEELNELVRQLEDLDAN